MIIGHYVSHVAVRAGYERNVSGHAQHPLQAMRLLLEAGHGTHLITNQSPADYVMPDFLPRDAVVHQVIDSRRRRDRVAGTVSKERGVLPLAAVRQARQIIRIARENRFDVLHTYGHNRTAHLGGVLRMLGLEIPVVATVITPKFPERLPRPIARRIWRRLDAVVTATEYVKVVLAEQGIPARVIRQGAVRRLADELGDQSPGPRHRVLFWRDATLNNGADLALHVYDALAPAHPDVSFDMAIRPNVNEIPGLDELARKHPNVNVHRFPYPEGISLAKLVFESLCVLLPMRRHSIDPQLVVIESMDAGAPVVASDINSARELIDHARNGMLIPVGDADAATAAVDELLNDRPRALEMGRRAAQEVATNWNWDDYVSRIVELYQSLGN